MIQLFFVISMYFSDTLEVKVHAFPSLQLCEMNRDNWARQRPDIAYSDCLDGTKVGFPIEGDIKR
jgi:hypothetical protein